MADFSLGKRWRAFCVVTSITLSRDTPLILLMYSAQTEMFLGSFLTCKHDTNKNTRADLSHLCKNMNIEGKVWTFRKYLTCFSGPRAGESVSRQMFSNGNCFTSFCFLVEKKQHTNKPSSIINIYIDNVRQWTQSQHVCPRLCDLEMFTYKQQVY